MKELRRTVTFSTKIGDIYHCSGIRGTSKMHTRRQ